MCVIVCVFVCMCGCKVLNHCNADLVYNAIKRSENAPLMCKISCFCKSFEKHKNAVVIYESHHHSNPQTHTNTHTHSHTHALTHSHAHGTKPKEAALFIYFRRSLVRSSCFQLMRSRKGLRSTPPATRPGKTDASAGPLSKPHRKR